MIRFPDGTCLTTRGPLSDLWKGCPGKGDLVLVETGKFEGLYQVNRAIAEMIGVRAGNIYGSKTVLDLTMYRKEIPGGLAQAVAWARMHRVSNNFVVTTSERSNVDPQLLAASYFMRGLDITPGVGSFISFRGELREIKTALHIIEAGQFGAKPVGTFYGIEAPWREVYDAKPAAPAENTEEPDVPPTEPPQDLVEHFDEEPVEDHVVKKAKK